MSALLPRFSAPFNGDCQIFYLSGNPLTFNQIKTFMPAVSGVTLSATNGSAVVTASSSSAAFSSKLFAGDNIRISGVDYTVLSVQSNTQFTLSTNYSGTTSSGLSYSYGINTDKDLNIYGAWAVSTADYESALLLSRNTSAGYGVTTSIPLIKYCKFELNLHYDED